MDAEEALTLATCPNCGSNQVSKFCPNCGQKRVEGRLTFLDLRESVFVNLLYFERRFIKTITDLFKDPAKFIEVYSHGRRRSYTVPFQFLLFFLTLYLFLYSIFGREIFENFELSFKGETEQEVQSLKSKFVELRNSVDRYMNYLYFMLPPIMAFFASKFFKKKLNYAEALVLSFYTEAVNLFIAVLFLAVPVSSSFYSLKSIFSAVLFIYIFHRFSEKWYWGGIKSLLVLVMGVVSFSIIIGSFLLGLAWFKGFI